MAKRAIIKIYGLVQGVNFRNWAKEKAEDFGLSGFVKNEADGSVYIEAEGDEENLEELVKLCRSGPRWARVDDVKYEIDDEMYNYEGFEIEY